MQVKLSASIKTNKISVSDSKKIQETIEKHSSLTLECQMVDGREEQERWW